MQELLNSRNLSPKIWLDTKPRIRNQRTFGETDIMRKQWKLSAQRLLTLSAFGILTGFSVTGLTNVSSSNLTASIGLLAGGTFVVQARTVTSAHTIDSVTQDHVIFADASGGAVTVTLVDATTKGRQLVVKKADASINTVTVSGSGVLGSVDTAVDFQLNGPFQSITLVADGTSKWFIV